MRVGIPGSEGAFVEIEEGASAEDVAEALAATEAGAAIADRTGKGSFFEAWPLMDDMDGSIAVQVARVHAEGGPDAVAELAVSENWDASIDDHYRESTESDLRKALAAFAEAVAEEAAWLDEDEVLDACCEALKDRVMDAMSEADESSFEGSIPSHVKVEAAFIPDYHVLGVDDMFMHHWDVCFSAETAVADSNFMRFLKFMNVSPGEFLEACRERGFDPANPVRGENVADYRWNQAEENAAKWRAVLDVQEGRSGEISKLPLRSKYEIAEWNATVDIVRTGKDLDRPPLVTMDALFTMLDNASYGGVAVWAARLPLKDLLAGRFDRPFSATGGLVGVHDFINGSGYLDTLDGTVVIDPSQGAFRLSSPGRYSIDDVYGFVGSVWKAETSPAVLPEWTRFREASWRRSAADGRHAEVTLSRTEAGEEEYWLRTFLADGSEGGPRQTAEVFPSLDAAKAEASSLLAEEWEAAAPRP